METKLQYKVRSAIARNRETLTNPKLLVVAVGGGISISDTLRVPGASALVHGIYMPYSFEETGEFLRVYAGDDALAEFQRKSVDALSAVNLLSALRRSHRYVANSSLFAVTAALTSDRHRRGDNHAYISCSLNGETAIYHLSFSKLSETLYMDTNKSYVDMMVQAKRDEEDETIACVILDLYANTLDVEAYPNVTLKRL